MLCWPAVGAVVSRVGQRCKLRQRVISTAQVFFKRFYLESDDVSTHCSAHCAASTSACTDGRCVCWGVVVW